MQNIERLTDMENVDLSCPTTAKKQELIRAVFDNALSYQDHIYRTPYLIPELAHNELIMRERRLLFIEKERRNRAVPPSGGGKGTPIEHLTRLLQLIHPIKH
jgi:hypothetical protein